MKKIISIMMTIAMTLCFMTGCSAEEQASNQPPEKSKEFVLTMQIGNPTMTVNGTQMPIDEQGTAPLIVNDRTLLPVRAAVEQMGGAVSWNGDDKEVTLKYGDDEIKLVIDSVTAFLNGEAQMLDVAPTIINDRTMLPIRFIAESFKFGVEWDEKTETVTVKKNMTADSETAKTEELNAGKTLVVYYSATGSTEKIANYIKDAVNADIFKLEPVNEYSNSDLDWTDKSSRVNIEHDDESKRDIELKSTTVPNFDEYDTVYIGYPIWWGIAAWPVNGFVKNNDFSGKNVIPFCTSASSGFGESGKLLEDMSGTGNWKDGRRFGSGASADDVKAWTESVGA